MDALARWMQRYIRAWRTNDPKDIEALFTRDARYRNAAYRPWREGREAIVAWWLDARDEPGTWEFRWEPLATDGDLHFVQGRTEYPDDEPRSYVNLWVIRLNEQGRCTEFTEWWMVVRPDA